MKKLFKKVVVAAVLLVAVSGSAATARGFVCVGSMMYESVGFWIFQFPVGQGMESDTCAAMMAE